MLILVTVNSIEFSHLWVPATSNVLVVGTRGELGQWRLLVGDVNWIAGQPPDDPIRADVKIRYQAREVPATINLLDGNHAEVVFDQPVYGAAPGQGAVFYDESRVLGGGLISQHE